jgi:hypothetical protein
VNRSPLLARSAQIRDAHQLVYDRKFTLSHSQFPSRGAAASASVTGIDWSDHWSFWQAGYPALMVTDTAPYRNPHYHKSTDTPDTVDYQRTARVVVGLASVLEDLAGAPH